MNMKYAPLATEMVYSDDQVASSEAEESAKTKKKSTKKGRTTKAKSTSKTVSSANKTTKAKPAKAKPAASTSAVIEKKSLEDELLLWLKDRSSWDHDAWCGLISELESKGFQCPAGEAQDRIGAFLETHRS
ncbi:MAG: hypothetical protein HQL32_05190 [Planctomycetes bacterium]|nr:hypothetical protein [Planctomycetota bacterium]